MFNYASNVNFDEAHIYQQRAAKLSAMARRGMELFHGNLPWNTAQALLSDAREYQRRATFLYGCARIKMGMRSVS